MKKPAVRTESYHTNLSKSGDRPACVVCGQVILKPIFWIRCIDGGSSLADEAEEADPAGDLGDFPIGSACRRRHGYEALTFRRDPLPA